MAGANLSGPGIGLPIPQNLYPSQLQNAPSDPSSNEIMLSPGDVFTIPAGDWTIGLGGYLVLQFLDPITGVWEMASSGSAYERRINLSADGFTLRIANLTGCVVGAVVTAIGSGYVQATTTVTAVGTFAGATPTFVAIVGGALAVVGNTLTSNGTGYGVAPIVMIPPPPPPQSNPNGVGGIAAEAVAFIANGTVSSVSLTNVGAGYPSAPTAVIVPSPFDPNLNTGITQATVAFSLTNSGAITGVLCTNHGSPLNNGSLTSVTLTVGGAGSTATLSAIVMQTVVSGTISGAGATGAYGGTTYGGVPSTGGLVTPYSLGLSWQPRPAQYSFASATVASPATIYDGGLFIGAPTAVLYGPAGATPTIPTVAMVLGSRPDTLTIQPGP